MSNAEVYAKVVSQEVVASFGLDLTYWTDEELTLLKEGMILAMKENPDWVEKEAMEECKRQVDFILFGKFVNTYGYLIRRVNLWSTPRDAYQAFLTLGAEPFVKKINDQLEYQDFCCEFYGTLREHWNICSAGLWDEYQRMKTNQWSFDQYRRYMKEQIRKSKVKKPL